jgi:hypothetical protein
MSAAAARKFPIWIIPIGIIMGALLAVLVLFALIQLIPYGRDHTNPPVLSEPAWNSPETRMLVKRACFDCHSNETVWPWYTNIAPVSWLVMRDVTEGRYRLNFSEWGGSQQSFESGELLNIVQEGEMPPSIYLIQHPEARLSPDEKQALIDGLKKSLLP